MTESREYAAGFLERTWGGTVIERGDQLYTFDKGEPVLVWVREDPTEDEIPALAVTGDDLHEMRSAVCRFLSEFPDFEKCRADVIAVQVHADGSVRLRHMVGAAEVSL